MATEPNTLVSAERAQAILDVCSVYPVGYPPIVAASVQLQKATCALLEAVPDLAETVIALHAEVKRLSTANIDLLDTLRAVARACTLPEDTAPASLPAQVEDCLRDLSGQIERRTRERDIAVARVEQLSRVFTNTATALDAVELLSSVLAQDAAGAPNCTEWRGSYNGREFAITVQWVDGKSPHALIDEARRERDDLRTQLDAATAALDSERLRSAAVPGTIQAAMDALVPLAARAYRSITLCEGDPPEHLHEPIRPDYDADNSEDPRIVLALHLGGVDGPLWQASVEYEGDMGSIPVDAGNHANDPLGALAELRASLEAEDATDEGDDDDTESD